MFEAIISVGITLIAIVVLWKIFKVGFKFILAIAVVGLGVALLLQFLS